MIGGDGSLTGAEYLYQEQGIAYRNSYTIDNDPQVLILPSASDTAMNTIVDAINKIRDTATSHEWNFIIETMGRISGFDSYGRTGW